METLSTLFQQVLNGLSIGSTYALIAIGYVMLFGVLRIVQLSHSEIFLAGAFFAVIISSLLKGNIFLVLPVVAILTGLLGLLVYFIIRPLGSISDPNSQEHLNVLVVTIGISTVIINVILKYFGGFPQKFPQLLEYSVVDFNFFQIPISSIVCIFSAFVFMLFFRWFISSTKTGLKIQATTENPVLAQSMGINVEFITKLSFFIASATAGIAAVFIGIILNYVHPFMGAILGFKGLIAMIAGGVTSFSGAVIFSLFLGITESLASGYISSSYSDSVGFGLLIIVLILKPSGLFNKGKE